ncbi:MAG: MBL fold metallo-hydrolase [Planctomycetes bacterium]|nr:MBL fold metallo-hydrolase [Planctomycetota bacterium]
MLFQRFEESGLSHYSYALGCAGAGEIAVVDPRRDVDEYLAYAEQQGVRIAHVLETHIHADFASGARELAERAGATLWESGYDRGERYEIAFAHRDLGDGDEVAIGSVRIRALHTPGHTPEHLSFLVFDTARARDVPLLMLSGDFLFVGSLGRPDLLGEEAKRELAAKLFASVRGKLRDLPDGLEVHPAHGAGSLCGAGMTARAYTTLGFERISNPYLAPSLTEKEFIARILESVPLFPDYYRRMKALNAAGPPLLGGVPGQRAIAAGRFREFVDQGHVVIDLRDALAFSGGHIPGAFGIGAGTSAGVWASWVVPYDAPLLLVAADAKEAESATRMLVRVGLDGVAGFLAGGISAWRAAGLPLRQTQMMQVDELAAALGRGARLRVLDVRSAAEWKSGHITGAEHSFAGTIAAEAARLREKGGPLAIICGSGYRSTVAASVLERAGILDSINVIGGMTAWRRRQLPLGN